VFAPEPGCARSVVAAGNFHGMPLALAFDTLNIALTHVAGIAERRVYYLLAASSAENRLNPQLSPLPGLHSGLMIAQYVAAACCNELIGLATPASVANLSTSAGMEDYNSFGAHAVLSGKTAIDGALPINPSGGLKARGHPVGASGLAQVVEVAKILKDETPSKREFNRGLTQSTGGLGTNNFVTILERAGARVVQNLWTSPPTLAAPVTRTNPRSPIENLLSRKRAV